MSPPIRVGDYVLKQKLGEGAFAEVRLGVHEKTGQEYAVKILDRSAIRPDFERDVKREIKIMKYLRHPGIVSMHAVLVTDAKLYLIMELVRGGELYDEIVKKSRIDEDTARKYFQQLVDAMVYCHRRGVVHRDLKPENLLLTSDGNLKITDFGMSWMKERIDPECNAKQLLHTQCGTPKYMAPEIIARTPEGYDGEKLDAWECGIVLYALLAGHLPFNGEDDSSLFQCILKGRLRFPTHFSVGARDVLTKLLVKDPANRASLVDIREHEWFRVNYTCNLSSPNNEFHPKTKTGQPRRSASKSRKSQELHALTHIGKEKSGPSSKSSRSKSRGRSGSKPRQRSRSKSKTGQFESGNPTTECTSNDADVEESAKDKVDERPRTKTKICFREEAEERRNMNDIGDPKEPCDQIVNDRNNRSNGPSTNGGVFPKAVPPALKIIKGGNNSDDESMVSVSPASASPIPAINLFSFDSSNESERLPNNADSDIQALTLREKLRSPLAGMFRSMLSPRQGNGSEGKTDSQSTSSWFASNASSVHDPSISSGLDDGILTTEDGDKSNIDGIEGSSKTSPSKIRKMVSKMKRREAAIA